MLVLQAPFAHLVGSSVLGTRNLWACDLRRSCSQYLSITMNTQLITHLLMY